jgi:hypothetical protein
MHVVESSTGSGLLVAEEPASAAQIGRLLREHEPRLRLVPQQDEARRCLLWQVWRHNGNDRPADYIVTWMDQYGEPLPLSTQIVERVKLFDPNQTASAPPTHTELNARHRERTLRETEARYAAVEQEHAPYVDRGRRVVSMGPRPTRQPADHI